MIIDQKEYLILPKVKTRTQPQNLNQTPVATGAYKHCSRNMINQMRNFMTLRFGSIGLRHF